MRWWAAAVALGVSLVGAVAQADGWLVLKFQDSSVGSETVTTFRDLLQVEVGKHVGGRAFAADVTCSDVACAVAAGQASKAQFVIFGSFGRLGSKLIVTAQAVEVTSGTLRQPERMTVDRVEDLEAVATRLGASLTSNKSVAETAQLGAITKTDQQPPVRRHGSAGFGLRVGGVIPLLGSYGGSPFGVGLDASYWYEGTNFAIEPRLGFAVDSTSGPMRRFLEAPIDVSAYWIPGLGDFTLFVGGGMGVRIINVRGKSTLVIGEVVRMTNEIDESETSVGFTMRARVGALLFRTWTVRMTISADYNITFSQPLGQTFPQSVSFGIGVIF